MAGREGVGRVWTRCRPGGVGLTWALQGGVPRPGAIARPGDTVAANRDWVSPELGVLEPGIKPRGIDDVPVVALTLFSTDTAKGAYALERHLDRLEGYLPKILSLQSSDLNRVIDRYFSQALCGAVVEP